MVVSRELEEVIKAYGEMVEKARERCCFYCLKPCPPCLQLPDHLWELWRAGKL